MSEFWIARFTDDYQVVGTTARRGRLATRRRFGETQQIYYDHMGGSRPRRRLGRLKGSQRETLLKESHAALRVGGSSLSLSFLIAIVMLQ